MTGANMNFMHALHHRTQLLLKSAGWVQSSKRIFAKLKVYNNGPREIMMGVGDGVASVIMLTFTSWQIM